MAANAPAAKARLRPVDAPASCACCAGPVPEPVRYGCQEEDCNAPLCPTCFEGQEDPRCAEHGGEKPVAEEPDLSLNLGSCDHGEPLDGSCRACDADAGKVAVVLTPKQAKRLAAFIKDQEGMGWSLADARALLPVRRALKAAGVA